MEQDINNMALYEVSVRQKINYLKEFIKAVDYPECCAEVTILDSYLKIGEGLSDEEFDKEMAFSVETIAKYAYEKACEFYNISQEYVVKGKKEELNQYLASFRSDLRREKISLITGSTIGTIIGSLIIIDSTIGLTVAAIALFTGAELLYFRGKNNFMNSIIDILAEKLGTKEYREKSEANHAKENLKDKINFLKQYIMDVNYPGAENDLALLDVYSKMDTAQLYNLAFDQTIENMANVAFEKACIEYGISR